MEREGEMATIDVKTGEIVPVRDNEENSPANGGDRKCKDKTKNTTEWVIQVQQRYKNEVYKTRESSKDVCIYKVPYSIRYVMPEAYNPHVVSLGPFFHSEHKKDMSAIDDLKLSAVEATRRRLKVENVESLIDSVKGSMEKLRDCYQDRVVEFNDETLAWMMTMDACFIIEYLCYPYHCYRTNILEDILKLENQIPLLVLKLILHLDTDGNAMSRFVMAVSYLDVFGGHLFLVDLPRTKKEVVVKVEQYIRDGDVSHILDLHRMLIIDILIGSTDESNSPSQSPDPETPFFTVWSEIPSATTLRISGVKLGQSQDGKVKFEKQGWGSATLSLPQIVVEEDTEALLRNLMALEECRISVRPNDLRIISYYICLLGSLIESKEDVALLRKGNIIKNYKGNDQKVADMFNGLCWGITEETYFPYDKILGDVKKHQVKPLHQWIAEFKERYCSTPWLFASLVGALLMLVMVFVQTIFSVKAGVG